MVTQALSKPSTYEWIASMTRAEASRLGARPLCVELGTWCGASAVAMAEGGGNVVSVDTFRASDPFTGPGYLSGLTST
ncbi:MAG: hypothetical protein ACREJ6_11940, partial [Candidatus Methylomirabilis sp.]